MIISIINNKGGVGKTTCCKWLGQALAICGKKVLIIDNDKQHNLSSSFDAEESIKTIRDIYHLTNFDNINQVLTEVVRETIIENLFYIPSTSKLSYSDLKDVEIWKKVFKYSTLRDFFDVIIFDNHPGTESLQQSTITCSDLILIPTQLKTFATSGLYELVKWLQSKLVISSSNIKIIPNEYKKRKKDIGFINMLKEEFSINLTSPIPYDEVFDELDAENKVLFFSRLKNKTVPYIITVITELFPEFTEKAIYDRFLNARSTFRSYMAKMQFYERMKKHGSN